MMIVLINKNYSDRFCPTIWHQLSIHDSIAPGTSQAGCKLMSYTVNIKFARFIKIHNKIKLNQLRGLIKMAIDISGGFSEHDQPIELILT